MWAQGSVVFRLGIDNSLEDVDALLRNIARQKDIPYQSLMKVYLAERVKEELKTRT